MLIAAGFCNLLLFLFAGSLFASTFFGIRAERVFLITLICNALLLYAAAAFHVAYAGFLVIFGLNMALYVPVLCRMYREGGKPVLTRFLTPGIIFALIFLVSFFVLTLWRKFYSWDEISHWGAAAQLFMRDGKLGCEFGGILSHASYPPGTCLIIMLAHYCFFGVPFTEFIVMYGHELLLLGIWLYPLATLTKERRWQMLVMCLAYLGFVPLFLREDFHTCYTDAPLACLFGLCVYAVLTLRKDSRYDLFALGIMTSFLFMIRNAGFGYAIGVNVLLIIKLISERRDLFPARRSFFRYLPVLAFSLVLPFVLKYSWVYLLKLHETPLKFGGTKITPEAVYNAFIHNIPERSYEVIFDFVIRLLCGYALFFAVLIFLFCLLQKRSVLPARARSARMGMWFFVVAFILFLLTTLIYYIFEFQEQRSLPSFDRYVSAFLLAVAFLLLFLWHDEFADRRRNEPPDTGFGIRTVPRRRLLFLLLCGWCVIATVYNFIPPSMFRWKRHRTEFDHVKVYHELLARDGVKFGLITSTGIGFKNFYGSYLYPENFRELKNWDPVLVKKSNAYEWTYVTVTTPEAVRKEFLDKGLTYVFIESARPEFYQDFRSLFVPGFEVLEETVNRCLFRVLEDGFLEPVRLEKESEK